MAGIKRVNIGGSYLKDTSPVGSFADMLMQQGAQWQKQAADEKAIEEERKKYETALGFKQRDEQRAIDAVNRQKAQEDATSKYYSLMAQPNKAVSGWVNETVQDPQVKARLDAMTLTDQENSLLQSAEGDIDFLPKELQQTVKNKLSAQADFGSKIDARYQTDFQKAQDAISQLGGVVPKEVSQNVRDIQLAEKEAAKKKKENYTKEYSEAEKSYNTAQEKFFKEFEKSKANYTQKELADVVVATSKDINKLVGTLDMSPEEINKTKLNVRGYLQQLIKQGVDPQIAADAVVGTLRKNEKWFTSDTLEVDPKAVQDLVRQSAVMSSDNSGNELLKLYASNYGKAEKEMANYKNKLDYLGMEQGSRDTQDINRLLQKSNMLLDNTTKSPTKEDGKSGSDGVRGVRNNNPGNLRSDDAWLGKTGIDKGGFTQFETPELGSRALVKNLYNAAIGSTISDYMNKYAPPSDDNPTESYINTVAKALGKQPGDKITNSDILKLAKVISKVETGGKFDSKFIDAGYNMFMKELKEDNKSTDNATTGNVTDSKGSDLKTWSTEDLKEILNELDPVKDRDVYSDFKGEIDSRNKDAFITYKGEDLFSGKSPIKALDDWVKKTTYNEDGSLNQAGTLKAVGLTGAVLTAPLLARYIASLGAPEVAGVVSKGRSLMPTGSAQTISGGSRQAILNDMFIPKVQQIVSKGVENLSKGEINELLGIAQKVPSIRTDIVRMLQHAGIK